MDQGKYLSLLDCVRIISVCEHYCMCSIVRLVYSCFNLHVVSEPCYSFCDSPLMFFHNFKNPTFVLNLINPN